MTAKWLDKRSLFRGLALTAVLAGSAQAQLVDGQWRATQPQRGGRVAVQVNAPTVFAQQTMNPMLYPRQPVQFTYVPTIVMSDGSVYANYGYGYQQVVTCGPSVVTPYVASPYPVYGGGTVGNAAPSGLPPVPNQQTRSQQMIAGGNSVGGQIVQSSCGQYVAPAPAPAPIVRRY